MNDLDRRVATTIFECNNSFSCPKCGSTHFGSSDDGAGRVCHCHGGCGCGWKGRLEDAAPAYSEEMTHAWGIVELLSEDRWFLRLWRNDQGDGWHCRFWQHTDSGGGRYRAKQVWEPTAPLAICKAALQTMNLRATSESPDA